MTLLFADTQLLHILDSLAVSLAVTAVASVAWVLLALRQRQRVQALARTAVDDELIRNVAQETASKRSGLLHDVVQSALADVAADQGLDPALVRGALYLVPSIGPPQSLVSVIPAGLGVQAEGSDPMEQLEADNVDGAVFQGKPVVTVQEQESARGGTPIAQSQAPGWAIAVPVASDDGQPVWVLSIASGGNARNAEQLHSAVALLLYYREMLELLLKANVKDHEHETKNR